MAKEAFSKTKTLFTSNMYLKFKGKTSKVLLIGAQLCMVLKLGQFEEYRGAGKSLARPTCTYVPMYFV
jgi:hypothetical protein